jgi:hypothetical protein
MDTNNESLEKFFDLFYILSILEIILVLRKHTKFDIDRQSPTQDGAVVLEY